MAFKVTDTREVKSMTQAGSSHVVYRVWLVTDKGATGSIDVPADKWEAGQLRAILDEKAESLDLAFTVMT